MNATAEKPRPHELVGQVQRLVAQNRRRWKTILLVEAIGWAVALPLAYVWLVLLLDAQFHLPIVGRLLASAGVVVAAGWAGARLVGRWRNMRLGEDEVALAIERRTPQAVHNRLINAVQLARTSSAESDLGVAVLEENVEGLRRIELEEAAPWRPAVVWLGAAGLMVLLGLALWLWQPDRFGNAAQRIFLPLARIDPLYRTRLDVEPGDVETTSEIPLRIVIHGERPASLLLMRRAGGKTTSEAIPVESGTGPVVHTLRDIQHSFVYAVRGGDFTSPFFQVTVPHKTMLARVRATYRYPSYTGLAEKLVESTSGDLEALEGTTAEVRFILDAAVEELRCFASTPGKKESESRPVTRDPDGKAFASTWSFTQPLTYRLEVRHGQRPAQKLGPFSLHVLPDQEPKLELHGIERSGEMPLDTPVALGVVASDDFGLEEVGVFYRRAGDPNANPAWLPIQVWASDNKTQARLTHELNLARLPVAEGDKIELAVRGRDRNPARKDWTLGPTFEVTLGGDGVALQRVYEQILRSQTDLEKLLASEKAVLGKVVDWLKKLDGSGDLRWDDPKNVAALHQGVAAAVAEHKAQRQRTAQTAQAMPVSSGNLRLGLGMLADTEMVRVERILESVATREQPGMKRAALADARVTGERVLRSLEEVTEQFAAYRSDWELGNMIPFTKMLAERQGRLRDQSKKLAAVPDVPAYQRVSMQRRQGKMLDLGQLIQPAFVSLGKRLQDVDPTLGKAFADGGVTLTGEPFRAPMRQAAQEAEKGSWAEVVRHQTMASTQWSGLYQRLREAQVDAAQKALAALREKAKSDLEAQKELEKLTEGSADAFVTNYPESLKLADTSRLRDVAGAKKKDNGELSDFDLDKAKVTELDTKRITRETDSGVRQDTSTLTLASTPGKTPILDMWKAKEKNKVQPFVQEDFDDLVGKLLDETEELGKKYQSIQLSTNQNNNDPGDIGKVGGALSSTGAVAATGNQKPPSTESGGVSRTGRQGARATGMVADQDVFDRRGRDKALEGTEQIADQAGLNKMHKTDDPSKDFSTGVGGKKIESKDNHFSLHDAGKWKDDMVKRLDKAQEKNYIVERQGDKIDAKTAAQLRDLTSKQEQVIERLKAIKKDLKNLYLPTEHLDELAAQLHSQLESLKERPEADLFRLQMQTLDRLRGAMRVFQGANAGFQPSLPRDRQVRGRVLDDPNLPALPGYEEAVRQYYWKLATQ